MLIRPWDAPLDPDEWRTWLRTTAPFGQLVVNALDPDEAPIVLPAHVAIDGHTLLLHLAAPNPGWPHIERARRVRFAIVDDYAYLPSTWRGAAGSPAESGVPTSYYAAVQFTCVPHVVDDPEGKTAILRAQLAHAQPEGGHAAVAVDEPPYGPLLPGIRGLRLEIVEIVAKFKFDDHKPVEFRRRIAARLDARGQPHDGGAAQQVRRRMAARGGADA